MTLEVAAIALKVDSTDAVTAKANLERMGQAGGTAAAGLSRTETAAKGAAAAIAAGAAATAQGARASIQQATAARTTADALQATGQAARLTGNQAAQLSAQLQDFFVQVQGGGSPLTALLQQGSQLSAVFGGVVPALRAVGGVLLSTAGAAGIAATAVAALGAAFVVGREQSAEFARAITLSGNAAGLTEGRYNSLAQSIADSTRTTIGSARETLLGLAASGRISGDALESAGVAAQLLAKVTGQGAQDIIKDFARAADAPAKYAAELNRSYNFLSARQLQYIRELDDQGRQQEALAATLTALIPRLQETASETTGLSSAFGLAKREASAFVDALLSIDRTETDEQQIAKIRAQLGELAKAGQRGYVFGPSAAELQAQLSGLERTADAGRKAAAAHEAGVKQRNAEIAFADLKERYLTKEEQRKRAVAELDAKAAAAGIRGSAEYRSALAELNKRFDDGSGKARLGADLAAIKSVEQQRLAIYKNSESIIDALRQAGTLSDAEFYDAKRAFVQLDAQTQEEALRAEIARLQRYRGSAAEQIEIRQKIADAQAKLAEVQAGSSAKSILLDIQQKASVDALKRAFTEMEFAAVAAYKATERRVDQQVAGAGLGDQERQRQQELFQIREQYTRQLEQLDSERRNGSLRNQEAEYQRRRQLILDNQEFEIRATEDGFRRMDAARANWENGASRAMQNYAERSKDVAGQVQEAMERSFSGMEDALVQFVTTGKLNYNALAASIVADITRIIIKQQIANALAAAMGSDGKGGWVGSILGSLLGPGRATGGPVQAGRLYPVNETGRGPGELLNVGGRQYLMAAQNGMVNANTGGAGGGLVQHNTFVVQGAIDRRTQQQMAAQAGRSAQAALARNG